MITSARKIVYRLHDQAEDEKSKSLILWCHIYNYRMAKIYCHINQCDASVQYFAILHAENYCTLSKKPLTLKIHSL